MDDQFDPKILAGLLRKPQGEAGLKLAEVLNDTNRYITEFSYQCLQAKENDQVLEIGFGNGKLMPWLWRYGDGIRIFGIDFSQDMVNAASEILKKEINEHRIEVKCAGISRIPYPDQFFNRIVSINTIYFWPQPETDIKELKRVLRTGGKVVIAFRPKSDAEKLPVTRFGFRLFEEEELIKLFSNCGFIHVDIQRQLDPVIEFNGEKQRFESLVLVANK